MANIKLKSSSVSGKVPLTSDLAYGELALNYTDKKLYFKSSINSIENFSVGSGSGASTGTLYDRQTYTATANQTVFSVAYELISSKPLVQVYVNGVLLDSSEYTAENGISITLSTGTTVGALVECIGFKNLYITAITTSGSGISYNTSGTIILNSSSSATANTVALRDSLGGLVATNFIGGLLPRVSVVSDSNYINLSTSADLHIHTNTQDTGTLTINSVLGTPVNGQKLVLRMQCLNLQSLSWGSIFAGSTDLPLPTSSSSSNKYDYLGFIYNSSAVKWQLLAKNFGF